MLYHLYIIIYISIIYEGYIFDCKPVLVGTYRDEQYAAWVSTVCIVVQSRRNKKFCSDAVREGNLKIYEQCGVIISLFVRVSSLFEFMTYYTTNENITSSQCAKQCRVSKSDFEIKVYYVGMCSKKKKIKKIRLRTHNISQHSPGSILLQPLGRDNLRKNMISPLNAVVHLRVYDLQTNNNRQVSIRRAVRYTYNIFHII